jgi:hypothetical protein
VRHPEKDIERPEQRPETRESGSAPRLEIRGRERSYRLNEHELATLKTVGTFRAVNAKDIPEDDVKNLIASGLMQKDTVYPQRDWAALDVLVLSREGEEIVSGQQPQEDRQRFHSGLVKVNELEHDTAIYPAYLDAAREIEAAGGWVERVVLDYELKSVINSEMNRGGSVSGEARDERKAKLAKELDLEIVDGKLPLPDLRIEYIDENGERQHEDIEIVSRHYHGAHLAGKSAAGFKLVSHDGPRAAVPEHYGKPRL